jgi:hypothetical protein
MNVNDVIWLKGEARGWMGVHGTQRWVEFWNGTLHSLEKFAKLTSMQNHFISKP